MYMIFVEKEFNHPLIGVAFDLEQAQEIVRRKRQGGGKIRLVEVGHEDVLVPWGEVKLEPAVDENPDAAAPDKECF